MSIKVALNHKTEYFYDRPVSLSPHIIRLRPAVHTRTPIKSYSLKITPTDHFINWQQDPFGNFLARLVFPEKTTQFSFEVDLVADMVVINPFDFFLEKYADDIPFDYDDLSKRELVPYLKISEDSHFLQDYIATLDKTPRRTIDFLVDIIQRLQKDISYIIRMEPGVQKPQETLELGKGSCRDSAWLLVQILRNLGFAARFVSGYLIQLVPDMKPIDGPTGPEADFTDLHAWTEVYLPGAGWVGLDPTSGLFAGEGHIPLAATPDPYSAAPVTGGVDEAEVEFNFNMSVERVHELVRVTKPYDDHEWQQLNQLGQQIDNDIIKKDIRLTMGGEPTFVSVDDMEGAEWNTEAHGPTKKKHALELFHRLKKHFAYGPLLHYGQGKWYPGEDLPRWAMTCYWRKDGAPIWQNEDLFADERQSLNYGPRQAKAFVEHLTKRLGISSQTIEPGYEDVYYYLWKEGTLPVNFDPLKHDLKDDFERKNLLKVLEKGLDKVSGYVLPLRWDFSEDSWQTGKWFLRRERMYLLPGDSPMGYRLPLQSIPHSEKEQYDGESSPFCQKEPLGDFYSKVEQRYQSIINDAKKQEVLQQQYSEADEDADDLVRTALCIEPRDGNLYIFMPPFVYLEQYLDLLTSIEQTAADLKLKIIIEGYTPPTDIRLEKFSISPDPGVIEVNVHPVSSWNELVKNTEILYEEARQARLSTEKFMLDGRHTGTGGGNHITVGADTPDNSPLLRNPLLLKSMISYWLNHPSLSYLFSGAFIGPTSQAPRVDEARMDQVFELEIAFQELKKKVDGPTWLVDRILRNLLTDLTGNTHRTEFCIDKLYSPDSSTGRLGLLELRAFEMPPHARMSMAQALLVRGLIAMFWQKEYDQKLVRWGTELHDKYMLPHFIWQDFLDVISELRSYGYAFAPQWYEAFYNFRFPFYGRVNYEGIEIELRYALEPWNVLGEENTGIGTARYVDSSAERLQIRVFGLTNTRHILTCNGRVLPLQPTGTNGEFVAGIKYKAWQPSSGLHPTIGIHSPLVIDVIDTWNQRSIGGCVYHVVHPGGLSYSTFPINSNEAETRRVSRFESIGHLPGKAWYTAEGVHPEFPYTLDLRKLS